MIEKAIPALLICLLMQSCSMFSRLTAVSSSAPMPELPDGSRVEILGGQSPDSRVVTTGTVLKSGPQGVALINCDRESRQHHEFPVMGKIPYVKRLFKNTGVAAERIPVTWISRAEIKFARILESPPDGYVSPEIDIDLTHGMIYEQIGIDFDVSSGKTMVSVQPSEPQIKREVIPYENIQR